MKIMPCPLNGPRNINEFSFAGEVQNLPTADCSNQQWTDYLFYPNNGNEVVREWWLHRASGYWFIAERHRVSDNILRTYDPRELFNTRVDFSAAPTG